MEVIGKELFVKDPVMSLSVCGVDWHREVMKFCVLD
jgi:hypothetical protein